MHPLSRAMLAIALVLLAAAGPAHQGLAQTFTSPAASKDAERLDAQIKVKVRGLKPTSGLRQLGQQQLVELKNAREAARTLMLAVTTEPKDAEAWHLLARALLDIEPDTTKGEAHELAAHATGAALRAYQRAAQPAAKAKILATMAEGFKRRSLWRFSLESLKASLELNETAEVRLAFDAMLAEHGFRIVDYKIDADAAEPRLCLNFSETLAGPPRPISPSSSPSTAAIRQASPTRASSCASRASRTASATP